MHQISLTVPRTARIFTLNADKKDITAIWIVVHGYGQLARYFLRHFEEMAAANPHICILAPEGLSRYYVDGLSGRVGASWMTKEDRESEIADQCAYFDTLATHILTQFPQAKLHLLGFSQGIATAWRWIYNGKYDLASLTLWAGQVPQEFPESLRKRLQNIPINYVYGLQDELIETHLFKKQYEALKEIFPQMQSFTFEGKHTMDKNIISILAHL